MRQNTPAMPVFSAFSASLRGRVSSGEAVGSLCDTLVDSVQSEIQDKTHLKPGQDEVRAKLFGVDAVISLGFIAKKSNFAPRRGERREDFRRTGVHGFKSRRESRVS
jgi:hypothetical protein